MKPIPAGNRSAVTNGTRTHLIAVGETETARRFRDLLDQVETERGGRAAMSATAQEAARAWAGLALSLELYHARLARGDALSADEAEAMGKLSDRMDRQSRRMGPVKTQKLTTMAERVAARRALEGHK